MPGSATAEIIFIAAMMLLILIVCAAAVCFFFKTYNKEKYERALGRSVIHENLLPGEEDRVETNLETGSEI